MPKTKSRKKKPPKRVLALPDTVPQVVVVEERLQSGRRGAGTRDFRGQSRGFNAPSLTRRVTGCCQRFVVHSAGFQGP